MIQTAAREDMSAVVEIAEAVRINPHNPEPHILNKGFLVYVLGEDGYRRRENPYFTLSSEGGATAGFLMCYNSTFLRELMADGSISHQDGAVNFLLRGIECPFLFGDQIAPSVPPHLAGALGASSCMTCSDECVQQTFAECTSPFFIILSGMWRPSSSAKGWVRSVFRR